ncbi:MAG: periplasmic heavy metal sensor [candidate division Zixibacteria bacterium]|nr:periplasmic heavy metal sensor [candidate division Zixibacteria bacterium]
MKKNLVILLLILLTIVNVAALATIAYHRLESKRRFRPMGRPDTPMNFIKQELDLNEKQVKEFESQDKRFREETKPILDSLKTKRKDLMNEIAAEQPSMDKLDKLTEEIGALQVALQKKTIMHLLKERSFLTPEQQQKFFSIFKERATCRGRMKGPGMGIGRGPRHPNFEEGE